MASETPLMKQYNSIKAKYPDAILLFRVGDFYETFSSDAVTTAKVLGITLTSRNNGSAAQELAGFPHHAIDTYLPKLVRAGYRVAICDQLEDPKLAKGIVKRGITEVVTPGVAISDNVLDNRENNYLCAVHQTNMGIGIAFLDISTGEFLMGEGQVDYIDRMLATFKPKEILFEKGKRQMFVESFGTNWLTFPFDDWAFVTSSAKERLIKHFETQSLKGFGIEANDLGVTAAGAIMHYLDITQHDKLSHINKIKRIEGESYVWLDKFTIRNLELFPSGIDGAHSLTDTIDNTVTPMGSRMLKRWISLPLKDKTSIEKRLDIVEYLRDDCSFAETIEESLQQIGDLERLVGKIASARISPREVIQLMRALSAIAPVKAACTTADCEHLKSIGVNINDCNSTIAYIKKTILPEPATNVNKGGVIANGVSAELDDLRRLSTSSKDYLLDMQQRLSDETGISSLKIGYTNVFGYYIEVRNTHKDKVPESWIRKQTLAQAERYITEELKEYENKILTAEDRILTIEAQIYNELLSFLISNLQPIQTNAFTLAELDVLFSFYKVAYLNNYCRPTITNDDVLDIKDGRHPVIEKILGESENYIANDVHLDCNNEQIIIITGPNMAGKSALLRQTALIVLMAQIGCFVPASEAHIGIVDKIFTRVGASDNISQGESTFMVEMTESANILNNVTPKSLVLFDELGRGTSTYDGISLAWSIVEYLHDNPKVQAKTLFATHYHELNEMASTHERIRNYNVSVKECDGRVIFMRKLVSGGSEHSFGIHVAKLAGMPKRVLDRANEILHDLENAHRKGHIDLDAPVESIDTKGKSTKKKDTEPYQLSLFQLDDPVLLMVRDEIKGCDINNLTPLEALNKLSEIKRVLGI